ncbi:MAG: Magnesium transporter MgtE [Chlamydiae bacterium]|nr:Magnesium transporter MgtE [Chlamydiota bacterium]
MDQEDKTQSERSEKPKVHSGVIYDTRTAQLDDLLIEKLEHALHQETSQIALNTISKIACEHDPIDLAHAATRLPSAARSILYDNLPDLNNKTIFMINAGSNTRAAIFRHLPDRDINQLLENMPHGDAVWMLDDMSDRRYKKIMESMNPRTAHRIRELQKHDRDSAGRLMTDEFFAFHMNTTIGEVADQIRAHPGVEVTSQIFVLNDFDELCGYAPMRNLIINKPELPLRNIMQPIFHTVTPDASRDEVVDIMERYELAALPVIDEYHQLVGVIPFESAVEAMKDIMDDTIANIAGTAEDFDEHEPIIRRFFWRAPWLIVTLCAGLTTAASLTLFQGNEWFIIVPFFIPLIAGLSGNVGIQCSTLLVRSISSGEVTVGTKGEIVAKELMIGLLIGVVFGILCGIVVYSLNLLGFDPVGPGDGFFHTPFAIAFTVCLGIFGSCSASTFLGSTTPFLFARIGIDPAVAAGPIVTAFNDVMAAWIFIIIARLVSLMFI